MKRKFFLAILLVALLVGLGGRVAEAKVNINTASADELQTLNGIGPTLAERIIAARPFGAIEDITRVKGIGAVGSKTYEKIKNFITVSGGTETAVAEDEEAEVTLLSSQKKNASLPAAKTFSIEAETVAATGVPVDFQLTLDQKQRWHVSWAFGDGGGARGFPARHAYSLPGTYNVVAIGRNDKETVRARTQVKVFAPDLGLSLGASGLVIKNRSEEEVNLGGWSLWREDKHFVIPEGTILSPEAAITLTPEVVGPLARRTGEVVMLNSTSQLVAQTGINDDSFYLARPKSVSVLAKAPVATSSTSTAEQATVIELEPQVGWWGRLIKQIFPQ